MGPVIKPEFSFYDPVNWNIKLWIGFAMSKVFVNFTKSYLPDLRDNMQLIIKRRFGDQITPGDYFWLCFSDIAKYNPIAYTRVLHFLNFYGFSRNVAMAALLYVVTRVSLFYLIGSDLNIYNCIILLGYLFISGIMFWNYLKLFKRQCTELFFHFYSLHRSEVIQDNPSHYYTSTDRT
ncbi:hypothetical protein N8085_02525 [Salibacteraceae bacterium]|nr:hypothetical protein [Salibacteraceae bacterium]